MTHMRNLVGEKAATKRNHHLKLTKYVFKDQWLHKYAAQLESNLRKVVREGVDNACQRFPLSRSLPGQFEPSESRQFKLHFVDKLPSKLFTESKVAAEGPSPITLLLCDAVSGQLITDGPLSSKKVEIVVLDGHFKAEQLEDWTKEDFCKHMLSNRNNKKPLLVGQLVITLHNGVGTIDDICFTDNSSWRSSKMFRLGAKVVAEEDQVREAVSSPFRVKDRRGETYQKHIIPSLEDEVWRLYWIAKDGKICKRLEASQIYKVKDLVAQYYKDESLLRRILSVSSKKCDAIIHHATSCFLGNDCINLSKSAQINIPSGVTALKPNIVSCSDMQQFGIYDQQEIPRSELHAGEQCHQLDQSNFLLDEVLASSCDDVHLSSSRDYCMPSSSAPCSIFRP